MPGPAASELLPNLELIFVNTTCFSDMTKFAVSVGDEPWTARLADRSESICLVGSHSDALMSLKFSFLTASRNSERKSDDAAFIELSEIAFDLALSESCLSTHSFKISLCNSSKILAMVDAVIAVDSVAMYVSLIKEAHYDRRSMINVPAFPKLRLFWLTMNQASGSAPKTCEALLLYFVCNVLS